MKAWVLHSAGDIRLENVEVPSPKPGEVLLKVMAAGICGSDIPRIYSTGAHRMPLVPGHEFSGIVEGIGKDVSVHWLKKRVGIYPLISCGKCRPCQSGHPEMCRDYDYVGSRRDGAFAEYVTVPARNLIALPDDVGFDEAAMLEPMAVTVHAMRVALADTAKTLIETDGKTHTESTEENRIQQHPRIAVCGLGTIGLLLVMFLRERGLSDIYVIGNKDGQRKRTELLGVDAGHFCDSTKEHVSEWLLKNTGGVDAFFECVGRQECVSYGIDASAPGGQIVLVGNPASDMMLPRDTYWKILRNQLTLRGTWNSTFSQRNQNTFADINANGDIAPFDNISDFDGFLDDWQYVLNRLSDHRVNPEALITHRLTLNKLEEGFHVMRDKAEDYCKVMILNGTQH